MKIALIGGGATNLLLAALLTNLKNIQVDIIEIRDRVGKKILETGNGKCNFTNVNITKEDYNHESFVDSIINHDIKEIFNSLGLLSYSDSEGRCFPISDASNSILDLLRSKYINNKNFRELINSNLTKIKKTNNKYTLTINNTNHTYDYVVLGIGSKVNNNFYKDINLNLKYINYSPSLCPLKINVNGLKGIRVKCRARLVDNQEIYQEKGEVIFKDNAISGISIFNISFYLNKYKLKNPRLILDICPNLSYEDLTKFLKNKINQEPTTFFIGLTNKMIGQYLIKRLNLTSNISEKDIDRIAYLMKNLDFVINGLVDTPQVASGGICIDEINSSLELIKYNNIFIGGEMIDIDGKCGGYNLHFAFCSAYHIFNKLKELIYV